IDRPSAEPLPLHAQEVLNKLTLTRTSRQRMNPITRDRSSGASRRMNPCRRSPEATSAHGSTSSPRTEVGGAEDKLTTNESGWLRTGSAHHEWKRATPLRESTRGIVAEATSCDSIEHDV